MSLRLSVRIRQEEFSARNTKFSARTTANQIHKYKHFLTHIQCHEMPDGAGVQCRLDAVIDGVLEAKVFGFRAFRV